MTRRTELGELFNEGARLLWKVVKQAGSAAEVAESIGAGGSAFSRWLYGDRLPDLEWAAVLQDELGIPMIAWTKKPSRPFVLPSLAGQSASA